MVAIRDGITGELETAKVTVIVQKDIPKYSDKFTILFQAVNLNLIKRMKPITTKLLFYFCAIVQYENKIDRTITEMMEDLNYSRPSISIALKELEEMNIVYREAYSDDKRRFIFRLNPLQSWKGKPAERIKAMQKLNPTQLLLPFDENINNNLQKWKLYTIFAGKNS